jgi:hypothetical protein
MEEIPSCFVFSLLPRLLYHLGSRQLGRKPREFAFQSANTLYHGSGLDAECDLH